MSDSISSAIITHLQRNRITSAFELSQHLGITKSAVLYHLKKMLQEGAIEIIPPDHKAHDENKSRSIGEGRGRPTLFYCLSSKTFENNLDHLSSCLFSLFLSLDSNLSEDERIKLIALNLFKKSNSCINIVASLNDLILQLNQHHYRASWESSKNGPRITFHSCPYTKLLNTHAEVCLIDLYIVEYFMNTPVNQISKIIPDAPRPTTCIFETATPHK